MRVFGRTGMQLSALGFGCGTVGGLMVRGDADDQERTVARAIAAGVNYFDTAVLYGNGDSERNLGRVLQQLKPANVVVGTKVRQPDRSRHAACAVAPDDGLDPGRHGDAATIRRRPVGSGKGTTVASGGRPVVGFAAGIFWRAAMIG